MDYPGVDEEGIFIVQTKDEITGFAIVSIIEEAGLRQGKILEMQVKDASTMSALTHEALGYCKSKNVDTVIVVPPPLEAADEILKDWVKFETGVMMTKTLSVSSLIQALFSGAEIRNSCVNRRIVFHVGDDIVEVKVTPNLVEVSTLNREPEKTDMLVSLSSQTLLKIVFCSANPYLAYLTRKVKVRAMRNTLPILKLLDMMKITVPLHVSLVDRM